MPLKERTMTDMRMELMMKLREGVRVTELAREYEVSRKTIYKFKERFEKEGVRGLEDRNRRPVRLAKALAPAIEQAVLKVKEKYPTWGAKKIRTHLPKAYPGLYVPARSTIHEMLKRNGAVKSRRRRQKTMTLGGRLTTPTAPNRVWASDFKGQFRTGDGKQCYPLTTTDLNSRFVLTCEALPSTAEDAALECFNLLFQEHGLPDVMRTDNGVPFASAGYWGLSKLAALWMRLGIHVERIEPGKPQQNGCHERMHRTLKLETARPAGRHLLGQQEKFNEWMHTFNHVRPHEALDMAVPADVYRASQRSFSGKLPEINYSLADDVKTVDRYGAIRLVGRHSFHVSSALQGQPVGVLELPNGLWRIGFAGVDLGDYDPNQRVLNRFTVLRESSLGATINH